MYVDQKGVGKAAGWGQVCRSVSSYKTSVNARATIEETDGKATCRYVQIIYLSCCRFGLNLCTRLFYLECSETNHSSSALHPLVQYKAFPWFISIVQIKSGSGLGPSPAVTTQVFQVRPSIPLMISLCKWASLSWSVWASESDLNLWQKVKSEHAITQYWHLVYVTGCYNLPNECNAGMWQG